ncbi:type 1 glutamine amidotransferase domain-containing protein [Lacimicrobium sp. SS2-24]|uniref:type 1 glutamine amidotransferase domain-containing protein n=1 Tax=Lacimicrobium sp. SS2-24 TaxID=2005569 RepID=UPI000B4BBE57|nr:type 1 glutamine amidotransferase domain-containing protein [Lacimicrobium sp. SS2-24]
MKLIERFVIVIAILLCLLFSASPVWAAEQGKKILMVVSSHGEAQGEKAPGYEFDEFAKAFLVFDAHGVDVDVASPAGGKVEADKYDPETDFNAKVLQNADIMEKLNNTLPTSRVNAADYDAVFVIGGKGAMFDLPKDRALQQLIADIYQQQGTVAAVCHGPAALVDVTLANGEYLIAGKAVNGFTNEEETLFGSKWMPEFDFMLEDKLSERGGKFQSSDIMLTHVAIDERLITGQNPTSTVAVAQALIEQLGISPVSMQPFKDDLTLEKVANILAGNPAAARELTATPDQYQMPLVGMYGYYYLKVAKSDEDLKKALTLMQLGQGAINSPNLDIQIAKTQQQLGDVESSKRTLEQILGNHPDFEPAKTMLNTLAQ